MKLSIPEKANWITSSGLHAQLVKPQAMQRLKKIFFMAIDFVPQDKKYV
jgi:AmiR/NasT family two-component response regulator